MVGSTLFLGLLLLNLSVGETGYNFLKLNQGPWGRLYSSAFVAFEGDPFEIFYNPASPKPYNTLGLDVTRYVAGITWGSFAYCLNPDLGFGAVFVNSGEMTKTDSLGTDSLGNELGTFSSSHLGILLSKRRVVGPRLDGGINLKFLYQGIDNKSSFALAFDVGALYKPPFPGLSVGLSLRNLGFELKPFEDKRFLLPVSLALGVSYSPIPDIRIASGMEFAIDYPVALSIGGEYKILPLLTIGVGYTSRGRELNTGAGKDILNGFSFALSLHAFKVKVQYVFTPFGELGDLHRIGTILSF
jgi:hypothetical protein